MRPDLVFALALGLTVIGCDGGSTSTREASPDPSAEAGDEVPSPPPAEPTPAAEAPTAEPHFLVSDRVDTTVDGIGEGPYKFTARWHLGRMATWDELLEPYRGKPGLSYLEIGVFEGRSLLWMFENVLTDPSSRATVIDPFMGDYQQTFDANLAAWGAAWEAGSGAGERVTKLVGLSAVQLRPLAPDSFDIIYIDGSHTADDVLADAVLSWPLLREGGMMIFDDYAWTGRPKGSPLPVELLPGLAIDAFITAHRNELELVHRDYQVFVRRKPNPCAVKDYCSPVGQYNYYWREFELRRRSDDAVIELSAEERELIELIARSKRIGDVGLDLQPGFVASKEFKALSERLELEL